MGLSGGGVASSVTILGIGASDSVVPGSAMGIVTLVTRSGARDIASVGLVSTGGGATSGGPMEMNCWVSGDVGLSFEDKTTISASARLAFSPALDAVDSSGMLGRNTGEGEDVTGDWRPVTDVNGSLQRLGTSGRWAFGRPSGSLTPTTTRGVRDLKP